MAITSEKLLDLLYNKKLPQLYRDEDILIKSPLKRYLEALVEGGYINAVEDIEKTLLLFDPMTIPDSMFPTLCESFGLEYFPDIDITYQRKFLLNLGELIRRRGTFSSIHYMVRALTGLEVELSMEDNTLNIVLLAADLEQVNNIETSMSVIYNYIQAQIPYYVVPNITSRIVTQAIPSTTHTLSAITVFKHYHIPKKEED